MNTPKLDGSCDQRPATKEQKGSIDSAYNAAYLIYNTAICLALNAAANLSK